MTLEEIDRALFRWWQWVKWYQEAQSDVSVLSTVAVPIEVYQAMRNLVRARERLLREGAKE